ncbi:Spo0E like sporulation regulatory protein [Caminicella sporogenes DSM 14501]|uniref:Spo0E like sporulation regulatory protein n=1 Tax=Caminicella sporogenes DSM 14501 TaxID=1121266 RepID=A0A1M6NP50_9FIRM|nr:Spo0E family sporulation regulatory protein-aspartic acid phosphatase [Caminicella sporogenes]WIF95754.1 Spo0E family sporulation regulatory protein-aspartic acid phosphatase [Caminicella sporogenes]SHJ97434.1 Spo0E like sporulation regulatory protein [Caminicella sporogenes DSM 14501]
MGKFRDRIKNFLKNDKGDKDLDEILKISKKLDKLISKYMEKDKNE